MTDMICPPFVLTDTENNDCNMGFMKGAMTRKEMAQMLQKEYDELGAWLVLGKPLSPSLYCLVLQWGCVLSRFGSIRSNETVCTIVCGCQGLWLRVHGSEGEMRAAARLLPATSHTGWSHAQRTKRSDEPSAQVQDTRDVIVGVGEVGLHLLDMAEPVRRWHHSS